MKKIQLFLSTFLLIMLLCTPNIFADGGFHNSGTDKGVFIFLGIVGAICGGLIAAMAVGQPPK